MVDVFFLIIKKRLSCLSKHSNIEYWKVDIFHFFNNFLKIIYMLLRSDSPTSRTLLLPSFFLLLSFVLFLLFRVYFVLNSLLPVIFFFKDNNGLCLISDEPHSVCIFPWEVLEGGVPHIQKIFNHIGFPSNRRSHRCSSPSLPPPRSHICQLHLRLWWTGAL